MITQAIILAVVRLIVVYCRCSVTPFKSDLCPHVTGLMHRIITEEIGHSHATYVSKRIYAVSLPLGHFGCRAVCKSRMAEKPVKDWSQPGKQGAYVLRRCLQPSAPCRNVYPWSQAKLTWERGRWGRNVKHAITLAESDRVQRTIMCTV